jgi:glycosidase
VEIRTPGFWEEFARRVRAIRPDAYLCGEIWGDATEWIASGDRFDGTMNYLFASAALRFVAGARVPEEATRHPEWKLTPPLDARGYATAIDELLALYPRHARARNLNLLGSHDTPRLRMLAGEDLDAVVLAAVLLFTFPGAPCIYYGDEIGMSGGRDPDCRRAFPWDDPSQWDHRVLDTFRALGALRRSSSALRRGDHHTLWPEPGVAGGMLHAFARDDGVERIVITVNAGTTPSSAPLRLDGGERLWGSGTARAGTLTLAARSAGIWRVR